MWMHRHLWAATEGAFKCRQPSSPHCNVISLHIQPWDSEGSGTWERCKNMWKLTHLKGNELLSQRKKGVEQEEWQKIKEELKLDISNRQQAIIYYIFLLSELKKKTSAFINATVISYFCFMLLRYRIVIQIGILRTFISWHNLGGYL